ncbi:MAG: hypothetical protein ACW964_09835, partial [Candidatus Hodarchaeales archaeon]
MSTAKEIDDAMQSLQKGLERLQKSAIAFETTTDGVSQSDRRGEEAAIKALEAQNKLIADSAESSDEMVKSANDVFKSIKKQNKLLKEQYKVTGRITQEFSSTGQKYKDFLMTTSSQYNYAQEIAKEYRGLAKSIALGGQGAKDMERSFKNALPDVLEMGLDGKDLSRVYQEMADVSGRITPVSDEDAIAIAGVAAGTGMMASDSANMAESFNLMGVSATEMEESLMVAYKEAQSMGLNANKVIKVLQKNMRTMQSYSFSSGVKGMTSMAKQAVKMRLDVSDVLQMADKFYQPEAAIEAAANLQMLGGDIAEAFGDPFETMYLARNKPEELAKKLGKMTENMMQFNEETETYEFPAEVRMQLKSAGEQLGINTDKMIEMARQTSKIKDIKMKFTMSGLDEEAKDSIASLATYKDGRYVIEHNGEELGLDSITEGMAKEIMKENQSSEDTFKDIAVNTQVMSEKMSNFLESQKARVVGTGVDMYELTVTQMEGGLVSLRDGMQATTDSWIKRGGEFINGMFADDDGTIKSFDQLSTSMSKFKSKLDGTPLEATSDKEESPIEVPDMVSLPGSGGRVLTGEFGSLSLDDRDLVMAGDPNKLTGGGNSNVTSSEMKVSGTATINVNINSNTPISSNMEPALIAAISNRVGTISNQNG